MDWLEAAHPLAALICLLACGALGWFVPHLIARIPEPSSEPSSEPNPEPITEPMSEPMSEPVDKVPYLEIARSPGLGFRTAITSAVVGGVLGASVGMNWVLPCLVFLTPVGVALAVVDWRTMLLPTRVIAPSYAVVIALVLLAAVVQQDVHRLVGAALGWAVTGGLFWLLWFVYPRGMGYGDVRLSGILGLTLGYLGWAELLVGVYAAFVLGGIGGLVLTRLRRVRRKRFPFGPFMLVGAVIGVAVGPEVLAGLGY